MPVRQTNSYTGNTVYRLLIQASRPLHSKHLLRRLVEYRMAVFVHFAVLKRQRLLPVQQSEAEMYGHKVGGGKNAQDLAGVSILTVWLVPLREV
jgi:hypothetical protein